MDSRRRISWTGAGGLCFCRTTPFSDPGQHQPATSNELQEERQEAEAEVPVPVPGQQATGVVLGREGPR